MVCTNCVTSCHFSLEFHGSFQSTNRCLVRSISKKVLCRRVLHEKFISNILLLSYYYLLPSIIRFSWYCGSMFPLHANIRYRIQHSIIIILRHEVVKPNVVCRSLMSRLKQLNKWIKLIKLVLILKFEVLRKNEVLFSEVKSCTFCLLRHQQILLYLFQIAEGWTGFGYSCLWLLGLSFQLYPSLEKIINKFNVNFIWLSFLF